MASRFFHPLAKALLGGEHVTREALPKGLIDLPLSHGETLLGRASSDRSLDDMARLIELWADPNAPDLRGVPPIVHAAISRRADAVNLLLNRGASVDAADSNGRTALHYAFFYGDLDLIAVLAQASADVLLRDVDGRAALDYARAVYPGKEHRAITEVAESLIETADPDGAKARQLASAHERHGLADLRGDSDFRRLDRVQQVKHFGVEGVSYWSLFVLIALTGGTGFFTEDPVTTSAVLYVLLAAHLAWSFMAFSSKAVGDADVGAPGANVRELGLILRAASRTLAAGVDRSVDVPARTFWDDVKLWGLCLVVPIVALVGTAIVAALVAGVLYVLTYIPVLGWIIMGLTIVLAFSLGARFFVGAMQALFAHFAGPILVAKITARQSALSDHINRQRALRNGGEFADGGVLYLRSFEFDGTFVSQGTDFELTLLHLFKGRAPLFALSSDPTSRGAVNLATDDSDWKALVDDMIPRAGLILMIPATSQGVLDEIAMLEDGGWFDKTLFIAPPENDRRSVAMSWDKMRRHDRICHLEIPPYCDTGFLFRLDRDGKLVEYGPLGVDLSPPPLLTEETAAEGRPDPDHDDDLDFDLGDGGNLEAGSVADGGAAAAPQAPVAASTAQLSNVGLLMQSTPLLTASQYATLSGAELEASYGGDGDGGDGGGGAG